MVDLGHIKGAIVIPNCVQLRLLWSLPNSRSGTNVLHASVTAGFTPTQAIANSVLAAIIAAAGWTSWKTHVNTGCSLTGVDIRDLRNPNQPLVPSNGAGSAGTGAGVPLGPTTAFCVTLRTSSVGPGFRGRVYLPGIDSTVTTTVLASGLASAAVQTDAAAFVTAVQTAMGGQGMTLGLAQPSRAAYTGPKSGTPHAARSALIVTPVSIVARNTIFDSQRRRRGRG